MASKLCDSCKSATSTVYCRADSAFLCISCDKEIHAANKLASRHARVWVCEVCEQAPAHVTCKADAAALCVACDRDIHSANPLARRHERVPVVPFYDSMSASAAPPPPSKVVGVNSFLLDDSCFSDEEEAEAASWLLPNPNANNACNANTSMFVSSKVADLFGEMDPYLELGYVDPKQEEEENQNELSSPGTDGVVPDQGGNNFQQVNPLVPDHGCYELDLSSPGLAPKGGAFFSYAMNSTPSISHHSVSISSAEVGVVPDGEISNPYGSQAPSPTVPLSAVDREARVMRYREKRKSRKFEKTIRYASRKAYAETRPRIKGRFAKRTDQDIDLDRPNLFGFGIVPSF